MWAVNMSILLHILRIHFCCCSCAIVKNNFRNHAKSVDSQTELKHESFKSPLSLSCYSQEMQCFFRNSNPFWKTASEIQHLGKKNRLIPKIDILNLHEISVSVIWLLNAFIWMRCIFFKFILTFNSFYLIFLQCWYY